MQALGCDMTDPSLKDTPMRVAKSFVNEIFYGVNPANRPKITVFPNKHKYDQIVLERNIQVHSTCEHHWQAIEGVAHVAYLPSKFVIGLSKLNRIVDFYARRPQIQENLTQDIFNELKRVLKTEDIAVMVIAKHDCCRRRGVKDPNSDMVTSAMGGKFRNGARAELMDLLKL
jgi:GTP cyclohydrolase I